MPKKSFLTVFSLLSFAFSDAQTEDNSVKEETNASKDTAVIRKDLPNLFFDCNFCNQQYYRQEINYVNFVRDRRLADIYLMVTANPIGSGGRNFKLFFIGENKFKEQNDTLNFTSEPNQAEADIRAGIAGQMKKGLLKYIVQTDLLKKINYTLDLDNERLNADNVKDKWNFWTFNVNANLDGFANSYQSNLNMNYHASANRTTEKLKTETGGWYNLSKQKFKIDDSTTVTGFQNHMGAYHLLSYSLGKHFALGHYSTYFRSTQQNLMNSISYYPAIEYNVFPYSEASRRQLRFIYRLGGRYQDYFERTVFDKHSAFYGVQALVFQWVQIEKWGSLNVTAGGWHYLNYPKNYNASIYPSINFNPLKGLRIGLWCGFSIVNDQLFLRASEATASEILLNQVQLHTDYNYNYGFNVGYTFGSKYNNVVNVRFDMNDNYW